MAIQVITNFEVNSPAPIDTRTGPYASANEATASISALFRYVGQTVIVTGSGAPVEYWFYPTTADTDLVVKSSEFLTSISEYYVDKRFTGGCEVTINSNRTISSTNINYLAQLSSSRVGDPTLPYPDPWSAGFAASASIAAGTIRNARVVVKTGNEYTYGSSTLAQNGDMTGSLVSNLTPDVAVSQIDYNSRAFDLLSPMVEYYFEPETALYNINKSWQQELVRYTSSNWDIAPEFKITGQGKFVLVYGQGQGFICRYGYIAAPRAEITIEADMMLQNMWQGWTLIGQRVDINVDKWWSYLSRIMELNRFSTDFNSDAFWNWPSQSLVYPSYSIGLPIVNVNINDYKWGERLFKGIAPHAGDFWTNIVMGHPYGTTYNINIKNLTTQGRHTDAFFRLSGEDAQPTINNATFQNNNINLNIEYISASVGILNNNWRGGHLFNGYHGRSGALEGTNPFFFENCNWYVNINKMDSSGVGLGHNNPMVNISNCTFKLHCDDYRNYATVIPMGAATQTCNFINIALSNSSSISPSTGSFINNQIIYSGNYRNYSTSSMLSYSCANRFGTDATVGTSLVLDNFNAYQLNEVNPLFVGAIRINNWSVFWPQYVYSTGSLVILKNSTVYVSGSAPIFSNTISPAKTPTILLNNVSSNKDVSGSFNFDGSLNISSNIENIFY
jgi:hypothetical protein